MAFRVSFRWRQQADKLGGWSENFWCDTNDATRVVNQLQELRTEMAFNKGSQAWCPEVRVSIPGKPRAGFLIEVDGAVPRGGLTHPGDYPTTKWQLQMASASTSTTQWIGGIVDASIDFGGRLQRGNATLAEFSRTAAVLTSNSNNWAINVLSPTRIGGPVLNIDPAIGLVTVANHGLATNDLVRISRVKGLVQANRIWRVIVPLNSNTTFQLTGWTATQQTMLPSTKATWSRQDYVMQPIKSAVIIRATSHKVGRPTNLLGGRRTTRRR